MKALAAVLLALAAVLAAPAVHAQPADTGARDTGHVEVELAPQGAAVPGSTLYVALRQKLDKGWHTYWRNPGDSGQETRIRWTLPKGWSAGGIIWATPQRLPVGPLMNYGYEDEVTLPVPISVPASAKPGETVRIAAAVSMLVCEEICIPADAKLAVDVPVSADPRPSVKWNRLVTQALDAAPKPAGLKAAMSRQGQVVKVAIAGAVLKGADVSRAYFFPFDAAAIDHAKPQGIERGPDGLTLTLAPGYAFQRPQPPTSLAGVLSLGDKAYEVDAVAGTAPSGAAGLGPPSAPAGSTAGGGSGLGLAGALAFAFLGGVVLNLMPCVFPILSMKAASLAGHGHDPRAARLQGVAFSGGVLVTFLALASVLIVAKIGGAAVGWGFQLQTPAVVAGLVLLMLLIALNLSGVYEIGASAQGAGASLAARGGVIGAFLTGILAVVVAAPCTAPFMAGALGYALTQSATVALLVFAALGLGFAAPFLALALSPALLRRLPRPGPWMEVLRRLLAFPMYAAAGWLAWVLTQQAGSTALAAIIGAGVAAALSAWLWGFSQRSGHPLLPRGFATMAGVGAVALTVLAATSPAPAAAGGGESAVAGELPSQPFTPERLAQLRGEGRPVLVNFTAAWCVTCQVNERVALSRKAVADAFAKNQVAYLKGDWTSRDAVIARTLAEHGRAGVPLYLVYGRDPSAPPQVLPQLLTEGAVIAALEKAAGQGPSPSVGT
jgi:thiol:disulfide interchange protein DsbD